MERPCDNCTTTKNPNECKNRECKRYREWFLWWWNTHVHQDLTLSDIVGVKHNISLGDVGYAWRYEHPDLIREGIIWQP